MDDLNLRSTLERPPSPSEVSALSLSLDEIRENIQRLRDQITASLPVGQLAFSQITELLGNLPRLTEREVLDLGHDSLCPICLNPLLSIIAEEEMATALDSPAHPIEELGVTKLSQPWQCGHVFCRRDISKWIQEAHDSCPMCRNLLVKPDTDSGAQTAAVVPMLNPNSPFDEIERQIGFHIDLLRNRLQEIPLSFPSGIYEASASPSEDRDAGDRSAYSGMYS